MEGKVLAGGGRWWGMWWTRGVTLGILNGLFLPLGRLVGGRMEALSTLGGLLPVSFPDIFTVNNVNNGCGALSNTQFLFNKHRFTFPPSSYRQFPATCFSIPNPLYPKKILFNILYFLLHIFLECTVHLSVPIPYNAEYYCTVLSVLYTAHVLYRIDVCTCVRGYVDINHTISNSPAWPLS